MSTFLPSLSLFGFHLTSLTTLEEKLMSSTKQIYLVIRMKMMVMMRVELGRRRNGKMLKRERGSRGVMSRLLRGTYK